MVIICIKTMLSKNRAIADIGLNRSTERVTGTDGASGIAVNMLKCVGVQWMMRRAAALCRYTAFFMMDGNLASISAAQIHSSKNSGGTMHNIMFVCNLITFKKPLYFDQDI